MCHKFLRQRRRLPRLVPSWCSGKSAGARIQILRAVRVCGARQGSWATHKAACARHQPFADQVSLAGFFHADGDIGLAHGQVQHPFLKHQINLEIRVFVIKLWQARGQAKACQNRSWLYTQIAKHFFFAVANACAGGIQRLIMASVASNSNSPCSVRISPRAWR